MNPSDRDNEREARETPPASESGGLFSDDFESQPVKRENPYLRKNKEKTTRAPEPERESAPPPPSDTPAVPRHRTVSDFIFEHVKLFTAILTVVVILSLVLITDVIGWVADIREKQEQADKTPLTLRHIEALWMREDPVTWGDLAGYVRYRENRAEDSITWYYQVKGTALELWISGAGTTYNPTYVYLYDLDSGERMDFNKDDLYLFLDKLNISLE